MNENILRELVKNDDLGLLDLTLDDKICAMQQGLQLCWYGFMQFMARVADSGDLDLSHWGLSKREVAYILEKMFGG